MTFLGGAPDFQAQTAQSLRLIKIIDVDTFGSQNVDLSDLIAPNDQALLCYWVGASGFGGLPCGVIAQTIAPPIFFTGHTQVADQGQALLPFAGNLTTTGAGTGAQLIIDNIGPGAIHILGTMYVFGVTTLPLIIPVVRRFYIGEGRSSGAVNVLTANTTTILAAPSSGLYYRIKCLSVRIAAAPAASARISWNGGAAVAAFVEHQCTVVAGQTFNVAMDWETESLISLTNNTSVTISGCIAYELWQA